MSPDPLDVPLRRSDDGTTVTLRDVIGGQPTLVVLMRHLDCPFCEVYVGRVIGSRDTLGRIVLVGNASPEELAAQHADLPDEFVLLADVDQSLYRAFRTHRLRSARRMRISLRSVPVMVRHLATGGRLRREGQDLLELGGDAVIGADGTTAWVRTSRRPDDRPDVQELASHLHRAA